MESDKTEVGEAQSVSTRVESESSRNPHGRRKLYIGVGVAVILVGALVVGGLAWHKSPSFCSTVCHKAMGSYVAGFYSDDNDLLITKHSAANVKCLDCHEATLGQQLREALAYVRGDYAFGDVTIGTREFCLSCHDWDEIVEATSDWTGKVTVYNTTGIYNPHNNHRGDADCLSCHSMHSQSILKCAECHEVAVPDGWLGYE